MIAMPPVVSVLMSVYQASATLERALASVLDQDWRDLELIVVDDGSSDGSADQLDAWARRDARVHVHRQPNAGLTQALVQASAQARGIYLARQDADDVSLPGRLRRQVEYLERRPQTAFVTGGVRVLGPADELLFEQRLPTEPGAAARELLAGRTSPVHGSVMMRAGAYRRAGGYRTAFRYAQDWDLWLRLLEFGDLGCEHELVYAWRVWGGALSSARALQQRHLRRLALACHAARSAGRPEQALLEDAAGVSAGVPPPAGRGDEAALAYFVGRCLAARGDARCLPYLRQAWRLRPSHARMAWALASAWARFGSWRRSKQALSSSGPRA